MVSAVLAPPFLSAYAAPNADVSLSVGAQYTSGDYGTSSKTNIWYVPVTLTASTKPTSTWYR